MSDAYHGKNEAETVAKMGGHKMNRKRAQNTIADTLRSWPAQGMPSDQQIASLERNLDRMESQMDSLAEGYGHLLAVGTLEEAHYEQALAKDEEEHRAHARKARDKLAEVAALREQQEQAALDRERARLREERRAEPTPPREDRQEPRPAKTVSDLRPNVLAMHATPAELRRWLQRFAVYYRGSNMAQSPLDEQHEYLFGVLDSKLQERLLKHIGETTPIFGPPNAAEGEDRSCIGRIRHIFMSTYPLLQRRTDLLQAKPPQGTHYDDWIPQFEHLAREADLTTFDEDAIQCYILITACPDPLLKRRLLDLKPRNLANIKAAIAEDKAANASMPIGGTIAAAAPLIRTPAKGRAAARQRRQDERQERRVGGQQGTPRQIKPDKPMTRMQYLTWLSQQGICTRCGSKGHPGRQCPDAANITCAACGTPGHKAVVCGKQICDAVKLATSTPADSIYEDAMDDHYASPDATEDDHHSVVQKVTTTTGPPIVGGIHVTDNRTSHRVGALTTQPAATARQGGPTPGLLL